MNARTDLQRLVAPVNGNSGEAASGPRTWMLAGLLAVAGAAAYANALSGPFIYDDIPAIVEHEHGLLVLYRQGKAYRQPQEAASDIAP